ncbi:tubulin-tyrosine ligase [Macrolepiota fuliginosa MF-IS2]|uniref:Tubulin-tyrosine ligase n=1 Tax=Macrolepiota fuliginosa MF-IS2 TaxID=1400762 RepID=A0A9P6C8Z4_9AGAR|nr:tubulin-tyrosine ligase [Macrolepiota fuliginosa MF-IS2]
MTATALVSWPSAPLTLRLVLNALDKLDEKPEVINAFGNKKYNRLIQWSTYDDIDHELTNLRRESVLASSYTFRKALIRKHYLAHSIHTYLTKNPSSVLQAAAPRTYDLDLAFADELDEKWADELYDLSISLDNDPEKWWILKPGMADRGMGIRLFNTKEALHQIFEEFELSDSEDDEDGSDPRDTGVSRTAVITSQLRHFVIQEYVLSPLLFDLRESSLDGRPRPKVPQLQGYKFHLRAYCVASGALQLYLYDRILALFCSVPYSRPVSDQEDGEELYPTDLQAHLTNTSLQTSRGEEGVRLFDELVGCHILDEKHADPTGIFHESDRRSILQQLTQVLAETFHAALQLPIHFQPLENAFELYGVDFLVERLSSEESPFQVKILEVNAESAIELTGPRLTWILEDLFVSIARVCIDPFTKERNLSELQGSWEVGQTKEHFIKCLDKAVRGARAPPS